METILSPPFSPLFNPKTSLSKPFLSLPHLPKSTSAKPICCSLRKHYSQVEKDSFSIPKSWVSHVQQGLAALAISLALNFCPVVSSGSALASEFDVLNEGPPKDSYLVDDAGVLSRVTKSDLKALLSDVEKRKGFHINFITVRKLTSKADAFEYADQVLEKWYPSIEEGNNKGIVVLVTSQKEGAITGGPEFIKAVGDTVLDATVSENLPVLATEEKYNEAVFSTARRLVAAIDGLPDPGGPQVKDNKRESNFKSREETDEKRGQFTLVVGGLLVIAFVVPMAQYYAYVSKK
ncbi:protein, chloroplastic [Capsicum galapagoense]